MIITRTPFRVSFFGGGSDVKWFYEEHGGCVISTSIDKYMYLAAHPLFDANSTLLKYSKIERVEKQGDIEHPIFREALTRYGIRGLDISVSADFPSGTGLGSSSSFTVGLVHLLNTHKGEYCSKEFLAQEACDIEINKLREPIGQQDQYAAAFGGLNFIEFNKNGSVAVSPLVLDQASSNWLSSSMVLVWLGTPPRSASEMLKSQADNAKTSEDVTKALIDLTDLAKHARQSLQADISRLGELLRTSWEYKKRSNPSGITPQMDDLINFGLANGALGAKLLGAGGSGFVLFVVEPSNMTKFVSRIGASRCHVVKSDEIGSTVIYAK